MERVCDRAGDRGGLVCGDRGDRGGGHELCHRGAVPAILALPALLSEFDQFIKISALKPQPDAVIGWGLKPTSVRARRYAQRRQLAYIALEDGFIRSLGLGVNVQPARLLVQLAQIL